MHRYTQFQWCANCLCFRRCAGARLRIWFILELAGIERRDGSKYWANLLFLSRSMSSIMIIKYTHSISHPKTFFAILRSDHCGNNCCFCLMSRYLFIELLFLNCNHSRNCRWVSFRRKNKDLFRWLLLVIAILLVSSDANHAHWFELISRANIVDVNHEFGMLLPSQQQQLQKQQKFRQQCSR